jgi:nucleotide-binding universal stress UspA family protein
MSFGSHLTGPTILHNRFPMRILACLDLTDGDHHVVESIRAWATRNALEVWLLHVMTPEPAFLGYEVPGGPRGRDQLEEVRRERLGVIEEFAGLLRGAGATAHALIEEGEVVTVISALADSKEVDAIVLGSRHRSRIQRLLTGSVLKLLLDQSTRPVVIAGSGET